MLRRITLRIYIIVDFDTIGNTCNLIVSLYCFIIHHYGRLTPSLTILLLYHGSDAVSDDPSRRCHIGITWEIYDNFLQRSVVLKRCIFNIQILFTNGSHIRCRNQTK